MSAPAGRWSQGVGKLVFCGTIIITRGARPAARVLCCCLTGDLAVRVLLMLVLMIFGFGTRAEAQTLQAGDTIDVSVWQDSKLDRRVVIGPTGMISFPLAGHIRAGGLTPQALENVLRNRLKPNYTDRLDITVALVGSDKDEERKP